MTQQTETTSAEVQAMPAPICPLRYHAYITTKNEMTSEETRCISDKCAWYYICYKLSNLATEIHKGVH